MRMSLFSQFVTPNISIYTKHFFFFTFLHVAMHPCTWITCEMKLGWHVLPTVHWCLLHMGSHYPVKPKSPTRKMQQAETGVYYKIIEIKPLKRPFLFEVSLVLWMQNDCFYLYPSQPTPRIWRTIWFRRSMQWWAFQCNAESPSIARLQSNSQRVGRD